jgi:formate dehydrogenase major subunit
LPQSIKKTIDCGAYGHRRVAKPVQPGGNHIMNMMQVNRRQFFKISGAALGGSTLTALGFSPAQAAASVRAFKLESSTETRNTCPYCSVSCGVIMYSKPDAADSSKSSIMHIEGDPDHPVNRGTLCPKGSALLDFVHSKTRLLKPEYRAPGSDKWEQISWDDALARIAKILKEDRDKNFIERNKDGQLVNRWTSTGFLAASATTNETAYLTYKVVRSMGMVVFDNQARV